MRHRVAGVEDSEIVGELYHQLIKDEGYRNPMTTPELIDRMRSWLITDYRASIFEDDTGILAYALYKEDQDRVHLRQLFVQRRNRRSDVGRQTMNILFSEVWPRDKRVTVDVLCHNSGAIAFWRSVGFTDYSLSLEILPNSRPRHED
jgi:GNAT superfamily N-acetyltransferase